MASFLRQDLGEIAKVGRTTLHGTLNLTGAEISINNLPAGVSVPFVHAHKENEEVYVILSGKGVIYLNGDEIEISEGSVLKVDPGVARCIKAADGGSLSFICIQSKANSLTQYTETDGYPVEVKPSWF